MRVVWYRPWLIVIISSLLTASWHPLYAQLVVTQTELMLSPGTSPSSPHTSAFTVTNPSTDTIQVQIGIEDWDRNARGDNQFYALGTLPSSCGDRIAAYPRGMLLRPRETQQVRVTYTPRGPSDSGCWSVVFTETVPPAGAVQGREIRYVLRTGVKVYVQPATAVKDGAVQNIVAGPHVNTPQDTMTYVANRDLTITFVNTGTAHLFEGKGTVEFRRTDNSIAATVPTPNYWVVPGAKREIVVPIPPLPAGHYVALALLDFGGADIAAGQLELTVP